MGRGGKQAMSTSPKKSSIVAHESVIFITKLALDLPIIMANIDAYLGSFVFSI